MFCTPGLSAQSGIVAKGSHDPPGVAEKLAREALVSSIDKTLQSPLFDKTLAAVHIVDIRSGKELYSRHADLLLRPASNAKLVTTAAAVLGMNEHFRFRTRLFAVDSSARTLLCPGAADPLLTSQDIQKLAEIAQQNGVRHIDTLLLDTSLLDEQFYGAGWMWDDESDPFMPYLGSFAVDGNTVLLRMKAPAQYGKSIEVEVFPSSSLLHVENHAASGRHDRLSIRKLPRSNHIIIEGSLRAGRRTAKKLSLWRPEDVFADLLLNAFRGLGVDADSTVIAFSSVDEPVRQLAEVSHPLEAVLEEANKDSDNLCAEALLRALALRRQSREISAEDGLKEIDRILRHAGISTEGIALRDGSGISFYNLITPRALSGLLRQMALGRYFDRYASTLAEAGSDGTLARRMRHMRKGAFFRGKTGTVSGVSALSGYAQAPGGRLLAVVILMQNFNGRPRPYREVQDAIVEHCITYSAATK